MFIDTPPYPVDYSLFQSISIENETKKISQPRTEMLNYFITEYPRLDNDINPFSFVHGLFENKNLAFAYNQANILNVASNMFSGSVTLNDFEQNVLNATFNRLSKRKPTRPNRN